jgi:SAM-dependent methyltransferase
VTATPDKLNLGCGLRPRPDCLNVDLRGTPDLRWDLNARPYPLPRGRFAHIYALDVVEHLESVQDFVEEAHELLTPGGVLEITTPHFSSSNSYTDPTHRHHLGYFSFDYFTDGSSWNFYSPARFEIVERVIAFQPGLVNRVVSRIARRWPAFYERRLTWVFPAWFLVFKLRATKASAPIPAAATTP